jgi:pyrimidine deaminase RibD-like protein/ubiquinone/menaquinone biosynthesis C-methylase UbiE
MDERHPQPCWSRGTARLKIDRACCWTGFHLITEAQTFAGEIADMSRDAVLEKLMKAAVKEAARSIPEDEGIHPKVGAIIVDENLKVVARAHRNERGKGDHAEFIAISKAVENGFSSFDSATIFATLEPCTHRGHGKTPCAERIVGAGFRNVFIGALDPNPKIVGHGETYLRQRVDNVERFPSYLEREIRKLNREFWNLFITDHLPSSSLYISLRVSDFVLQKLRAKGIDIKALPTESEYSLQDLVALIHGKGLFSSDRAKLGKFLEQVRSEAFDHKYSEYTYEHDARRIENRWRREVPGILKRFKIYDYPKRRIVNVGFGNGIEGVELFEECEHFIAVDIAPESLKNAQALFPKATMYQNAAEDLVDIPDDSQDIYLSLRTYQSSFFDVPAAVREVHRVVAPGGIVILSVANAYLEGNSFIKGLLPHGSKIVDQDRAHELIKGIRHFLQKLGFEDVGVHSGKAEEYVFGRRRY